MLYQHMHSLTRGIVGWDLRIAERKQHKATRPDRRYGKYCTLCSAPDTPLLFSAVPIHAYMLLERNEIPAKTRRKNKSRQPTRQLDRTVHSECNREGLLASLARAGHLFLTIPHPCQFLPPPHQTIWSTFSPCLRIWPILCTQFMMMARLVVGSCGSDILCR